MKVFLAAPFTQLLRDDVPGIGHYRSLLSQIIGLLEEAQIDVHSSHKREQWGAALDKPEIALRTDLDEIFRSDLLVAILGSPPSPGVQLEIGFAIALNKMILVLSKKGAFIPYLNRGFSIFPNVTLLEYSDDLDLIALVKKYVSTAR